MPGPSLGARWQARRGVRDHGLRGRGVASALLCAKLHALARRGIPEIRINAAAENPTAPLGCTSAGLRVVKHHPRYRKPLDNLPGSRHG